MTKKEKHDFILSYRIDYEIYLKAYKNGDQKTIAEYLTRISCQHYLATQVLNISYDEMDVIEAEARKNYNLLYN